MKQSMRVLGVLFFGVFTLFYAGFASAEAAEVVAAEVVATDADTVRERLESAMPQLKIKSVTASPVPGMYEVVFDGYRIVYVSEDASHVFDGSLMELASGRNLTHNRSAELQLARYEEMGKVWLKMLHDFGLDRYVNYEGDSKGELKGREMFVFTDITCPYCARFHQQIGELTDEGIAVRYILFARAGKKSEPHRQHINIWCSDDRLQALTDGKAGKKIPSAECEHPVDDHMTLTADAEVNATPTIILDTGERVDGFRPAADFIEMIKAKPALSVE